MKITLFSDEYPPILGGAGIVAKQIVKSANKFGHNMKLFCPAIENKKLFRFFWPASYLNYSLYYNYKHSDCVIVNDVRSAYILGFLTFFKLIKLVNVTYIIHGTEYLVAYENNRKNKIMRFSFFYNHFLKNVRKIISVSNFTKELFLKNTTCDVCLDMKIITQYAGIDNDFLAYKKIDPFLDKKTFDLVSVSRIEERKGFFEMLSIFKKLVDKKDNLRWHIYGNGKSLPLLKELVKKNHLSDKVLFKEETQREIIYDKEFSLYNYDLFWLLPNKPEAFGLVYIEAAILGVPALGVDKYGIQESVSNLFYKDPDNLLSLIESIEKNKEYYSDAATVFAKKFLSDNFFNELIK